LLDNLAPSGRYIHKLTSPAGIPLVINYDIPFDDFSFGVASGASHGQVQYFPGKSTQIVSGESVTGNNLIIIRLITGIWVPTSFLCCIVLPTASVRLPDWK
jgi:hypothetical protein